jgi:hypothetical protein
MSNGEQDRRLERVEMKIDRLSETLVTMARVEERLTTVLKQQERFIARLDNMERRMEDVEIEININKKFVGGAERLTWVIITASIAAAFYFLRV